MSYSFSVRASTKDDVLRQATAKFDDVLRQQPVHQADVGEALVAVTAIVGKLPDQPERDINLSVSGSVGWIGSSAAPDVTGISLSINAQLVVRG